MPWMIGIDEAGYGPNLGPLVMTSVACRIPEGLTKRASGFNPEAPNLWKLLRKAVRRLPRRTGSAKRSVLSAPHCRARLIVDDSKLVYSPTRGLLILETGVLATAQSAQRSALSASRSALHLHEFLDWLCPAHRADLDEEPWYSGLSTLPIIAKPSFLARAAGRFAQTCEAKGIAWGCIRSVVIYPRRFNSILDQWNTKGAVLSQALAELLQCNLDPDDGIEPLWLHVDKHGGRDYYAAILQHALSDYMVFAQEESAQRSVYRLFGGKRAIQLTIQPRADAEHFCVALASMVSKYLRELLMLEFNRFWQTHMPGLKATAGYPGDAERFYQEIGPVVKRLGFAEAALWRRK